MKATTEIMLGIRSVGDKSSEPIIESMTAVEAVKKIAVFTLESTMKQRFQFVLGRSREDVLIGLGLKQTVQEARRMDRALEAAEFIDSLFESADAPAGGPRESAADIQRIIEKTPRLNPSQGLPLRRAGEES